MTRPSRPEPETTRSRRPPVSDTYRRIYAVVAQHPARPGCLPGQVAALAEVAAPRGSPDTRCTPLPRPLAAPVVPSWGGRAAQPSPVSTLRPRPPSACAVEREGVAFDPARPRRDRTISMAAEAKCGRYPSDSAAAPSGPDSVMGSWVEWGTPPRAPTHLRAFHHPSRVAAPASAQISAYYRGTERVGTRAVPATAQLSLERGGWRSRSGAHPFRMTPDREGRDLSDHRRRRQDYLDVESGGDDEVMSDVEKELAGCPRTTRSSSARPWRRLGSPSKVALRGVEGFDAGDRRAVHARRACSTTASRRAVLERPPTPTRSVTASAPR